jgi:hypothetical protein
LIRWAEPRAFHRVGPLAEGPIHNAPAAVTVLETVTFLERVAKVLRHGHQLRDERPPVAHGMVDLRMNRSRGLLNNPRTELFQPW